MRPPGVREEENLLVPANTDILFPSSQILFLALTPFKVPCILFAGVEDSCECLWIAILLILTVWKILTINLILALSGVTCFIS